MASCNKWLILLVFGTVFVSQTRGLRISGYATEDSTSSSSGGDGTIKIEFAKVLPAEEAEPNRNAINPPGTTIRFSYDRDPTHAGRYANPSSGGSNQNRRHVSAYQGGSGGGPIVIQYATVLPAEEAEPNRNAINPRRHRGAGGQTGQQGDFYAPANVARTDAELEDLIGRVTEQEEREYERQREIAYKQRGGPRDLKLALTKVNPSSSEYKPSEECRICLDELGTESESVAKLANCGHLFHSDCLTRWSQVQDYYDKEPKCPICRKSFQAK